MPQGCFFPTGQGFFLSFNKLLWVVTLISIIVVFAYSFLRCKQFTAHSTLLVHIWLDLAVISSRWDLLPCYLRSTRPWSSIMSSSPDISIPIVSTGCYRINQTNHINSNSIPNTAVTSSLCVWPKLKLSLAPGQKGNWLTSYMQINTINHNQQETASSLQSVTRLFLHKDQSLTLCFP